MNLKFSKINQEYFIIDFDSVLSLSLHFIDQECFIINFDSVLTALHLTVFINWHILAAIPATRKNAL